VTGLGGRSLGPNCRHLFLQEWYLWRSKSPDHQKRRDAARGLGGIETGRALSAKIALLVKDEDRFVNALIGP
jgi:hypothetical protein